VNVGVYVCVNARCGGRRVVRGQMNRWELSLLSLLSLLSSFLGVLLEKSGECSRTRQKNDTKKGGEFERSSQVRTSVRGTSSIDAQEKAVNQFGQFV
jgi:hypothetical protein